MQNLFNIADGSFSEFFYDLKRISGNESDGLTSEERNLSLFCLVILPYIKTKIERKLSVYRLELADSILFNVSIF